MILMKAHINRLLSIKYDIRRIIESAVETRKRVYIDVEEFCAMAEADGWVEFQTKRPDVRIFQKDVEGEEIREIHVPKRKDSPSYDRKLKLAQDLFFNYLNEDARRELKVDALNDEIEI